MPPLTVGAVQTGEEALKQESVVKGLEKGRYAVVLVNNQMGASMAGLETARVIRQREQEIGASRLPLIILSAEPAQELEAQAKAAGAEAYYEKPLTSEQAKQLLERYVLETAALTEAVPPPTF